MISRRGTRHPHAPGKVAGVLGAGPPWHSMSLTVPSNAEERNCSNNNHDPFRDSISAAGRRSRCRSTADQECAPAAKRRPTRAKRAIGGLQRSPTAKPCSASRSVGNCAVEVDTSSYLVPSRLIGRARRGHGRGRRDAYSLWRARGRRPQASRGPAPGDRRSCPPRRCCRSRRCCLPKAARGTAGA
jgi:hypothetical protein